jgi:hypothetical protein
MMLTMPNRPVIFEFIPIGAYMKVTAMDEDTLTEVTIQGPVHAPEAVLKAQALKRLDYVLKKKGIV